MPSTISFDVTSCTRCGACVNECPTDALQMSPDSPPTVQDVLCIGCGHCGAVCYSGAVRSSVGDFPLWHDPSLESDAVKAFLSGRRSVRHYRSATISRETIHEVLSIGTHAPTASNAQDVSATVFTDSNVFRFATLVNNYYAWFARLLRHRALFPLLWFTAARPYLKNDGKLASVTKRLNEFSRDHDWVFFGAPAVVVLSAPRKHKDFGRVNCVIAAERMMLYANALGLGSCYIGFAEVALRRRRQIAREMGLSGEYEPLVVFTLGVPAVHYHRLPARRSLPVTYIP